MNHLFANGGRGRRLAIESLENRLLLSVAEPNNTPATAIAVTDVYLEKAYFASDAVSTATDQDDYFYFYNLNGPSLLYASLYNLSADADLAIFKGDTIIAQSTNSGASSELIQIGLEANSGYHVRVRAFNGSTNYSLALYNDYAGSTLSTARDLGAAWGQSSERFWPTGTVFYHDYMDFRDNVDLVKFQLESPGTISARRLSVNAPYDLASTMQVLDQGGNIVANSSSADGALNIDRISAPAGTYYLKFAHQSGSGDYDYRLNVDYAGDSTATARDLGDLTGISATSYDMVGGPFGLPTYEDATDIYRFTFSASAPLKLDLTLNGVTPPTFDASLRLARDLNGNGFISADEVFLSSANAGDDSLSTLLGPGTYFALVDQSGAYTSYRLNLSSDYDTVPNSTRTFENMSQAVAAGPLVGERFLRNAFDSFDHYDYFSFELTQTARFSLEVVLDGARSRNAELPRITLIQDQDSNLIFNFTTENLGSSDTGFLGGIMSAGTYFVLLVGGLSGAPQVYDLRMEADYAGDNMVDARSFAPIEGAHPPLDVFFDFIGGNDLDFYRFVVPDGYFIRLNAVGDQPLILNLIQDLNANKVIDADEILKTSNLPEISQEIGMALDAGEYFVLVNGTGDNYSLALTALNLNLSTADFTADDRVDGSDFLLWQRGVGRQGVVTRSDGDADGDRDVDQADLAIWRDDFGRVDATAAATPQVTAAPVRVATREISASIPAVASHTADSQWISSRQSSASLLRRNAFEKAFDAVGIAGSTAARRGAWLVADDLDRHARSRARTALMAPHEGAAVEELNAAFADFTSAWRWRDSQ